MDWIVWLVVIIVVVAVVWRLLNRNKSRPGADSTSAGRPPAPAASSGTSAGRGGSDATAAAVRRRPSVRRRPVQRPPVQPAAMAAPDAAQAPEPAAPAREAAPPRRPNPRPPSGPDDQPGAEAAPEAAGAPGNAEWETQWSETAPPADTHAAPAHHEPAHGAHVAAAAEAGAAGGTGGRRRAFPSTTPNTPSPTRRLCPGRNRQPRKRPKTSHVTGTARRCHRHWRLYRHAGTAMPECPTPADAAPGQAAPSQTRKPRRRQPRPPQPEASASHTAEPTGHLATDQPYGEGSAAPAADGSGPEGFTVKGNASSMIYHDETSPAYEETRAEVWFASAAHAEAAGFRPPRRTRQ